MKKMYSQPVMEKISLLGRGDVCEGDRDPTPGGLPMFPTSPGA